MAIGVRQRNDQWCDRPPDRNLERVVTRIRPVVLSSDRPVANKRPERGRIVSTSSAQIYRSLPRQTPAINTQSIAICIYHLPGTIQCRVSWCGLSLYHNRFTGVIGICTAGGGKELVLAYIDGR